MTLGILSTNLLFIALMLFLLSCIFIALNRSAKKHPSFNQYVLTLKIVLFAWLILVAILAILGFYKNASAVPPRLVFLISPPLIGIIYLYRSKKFELLLNEIPHQWLVYIQSFRILMECILWLLFVQNTMPVQMTFEGRNFDLISGLTAPLVAYFGIIKGKMSSTALIVWNIACVLILTNTVITGFLSAPTPLRIFMNEPSTEAITLFPLSWLPGFVVPFAICMHFLSIRKIILQQRLLREER